MGPPSEGIGPGARNGLAVFSGLQSQVGSKRPEYGARWRKVQATSAANLRVAFAAPGRKLGVENAPLYLVRFCLTPQETPSRIRLQACRTLGRQAARLRQ